MLGSLIWFPEGSSFFSTPLSKVGFVLAIVVWCVFVLQDGVMVGLRQAAYIPIENLVHSVSRILFLVVLLNVLPQTAMFAAWVMPVLPLLFWLLIG